MEGRREREREGGRRYREGGREREREGGRRYRGGWRREGGDEKGEGGVKYQVTMLDILNVL